MIQDRKAAMLNKAREEYDDNFVTPKRDAGWVITRSGSSASLRPVATVVAGSTDRQSAGEREDYLFPDRRSR